MGQRCSPAAAIPSLLTRPLLAVATWASFVPEPRPLSLEPAGRCGGVEGLPPTSHRVAVLGGADRAGARASALLRHMVAVSVDSRLCEYRVNELARLIGD